MIWPDVHNTLLLVIKHFHAIHNTLLLIIKHFHARSDQNCNDVLKLGDHSKLMSLHTGFRYVILLQNPRIIIGKQLWTNIWVTRLKLAFVILVCVHTGKNGPWLARSVITIILISSFALVWNPSLFWEWLTVLHILHHINAELPFYFWSHKADMYQMKCHISGLGLKRDGIVSKPLITRFTSFLNDFSGNEYCFL